MEYVYFGTHTHTHTDTANTVRESESGKCERAEGASAYRAVRTPTPSEYERDMAAVVCYVVCALACGGAPGSSGLLIYVL